MCFPEKQRARDGRKPESKQIVRLNGFAGEGRSWLDDSGALTAACGSGSGSAADSGTSHSQQSLQRASRAAMICAGVLGAVRVDIAGWLPANAASENSRFDGHGPGCFARCGRRLDHAPRQRCASLSAILNSCSFWAAKSCMY